MTLGWLLEHKGIQNPKTIFFFFLDVRNLTRKIIELLELDSTKLESIKKLINNYTRNRFEIGSIKKIVKLD